MAIEVAKREGKKKSVDIAQIKEIIKITDDVLSEHTEKYIKGGENIMPSKKSAQQKPKAPAAKPAADGTKLVTVMLPKGDVEVLKKVIANNK